MCGNPINAATGNKLQIETDFVGAPQTQLELMRYYNSQDATATAFGANWRGSYHRGLVQPDSTTAKVTRADGRVDTFTLNAGVWQADPDVTSRLIAVTNGWQLVLEDDTIELYLSDGRLSTITTRAGLVTTLSYDTSTRLSTVTGPFGHRLLFAYDSASHVSQVTIPDGGVYRYAYDAQNNLVSVTYPDNAVRQYLYENASFPHVLTGIIDENGNRFATYAYDTQGRATSTQHAGGAELTTVTYNSDGSADVRDARNNTYGYDFTTQFDVVKPTAVSGAPVQTAGGKAFEYDSNGFLSSRTDFNGNVTTYEHDARGLETSRTEASGTPLARTITTTWHSTFHLPTQITEPNRVTTFTYDARGNLLQKTVTAGALTRTWKYSYNSFGQVLTMDGPRTDAADVTSNTYNAQGGLATTTDALGYITRFTSYDTNGRLLSATDPNGLVTTLTYDPRGRLTSRKAGAETTSYTYDAAGNLTKVTLPDGSFLAYSYDNAHRLIRIADALGNHIDYTLDATGNRTKEGVFDPNNALTRARSHAYDAVNRLAQDIGAQNQTTMYGYDDNGNLTSVIDPLNHATAYRYDALNRLTETTDPNNGVTSLSYDANDNTTRVIDPEGLLTTYAYDGLGNQTIRNSPDTRVTKNTYDAAGNLITSIDARRKKTMNTYDALNRLTQQTFTGGITITYQYDQGANGIGHLTTMSDPTGTTTWSYDQHGRVTQKEQRTGAITLTTHMSYDAAGRLASTTYPSGKTISYTYDADGRVSSIRLNGATLLDRIAYRPFGPVASWVEDGNANYMRSFDLDGRIGEIAVDGSGSPPGGEVMAFDYDAASRIVGITNTGFPDKHFNYDALDRLTQYSSGTTSQGYAYDDNGNRLTLQTGTGHVTYTYAADSNRLVSQVSGAVTQKNKYDTAGNLTKGGAITYLYDARGRLTRVTVQNAKTEYAINGLGQRVGKSGPSIPTGAVNFVYDEAGHLMGEYDASGAMIQETVWLGDLPVMVLKTNTHYFVNPDHLGAPRSVAFANGRALWTWDHDPFGVAQPNQNPNGFGNFVYNLRFPGQYYDSETGLHYNMARDYDPNTGRYIQSDPIGLAGGVNTYGYVGGNPIGFVDSAGLDWELSEFGVVYKAWKDARSDVARIANIPKKYGTEIGILASVLRQYRQNGQVDPRQAFAEGLQFGEICESEGKKILSNAEAKWRAIELLGIFYRKQPEGPLQLNPSGQLPSSNPDMSGIATPGNVPDAFSTPSFWVRIGIRLGIYPDPFKAGP